MRKIQSYVRPASYYDWKYGTDEYFRLKRLMDDIMRQRATPENAAAWLLLSQKLKACSDLNKKLEFETSKHYQPILEKHEKKIIYQQHPAYCQPCKTGYLQNAHR